MRNFMNGISKGLAFIMAAAMVFTSVPTPVLASEISTVEESGSIQPTGDVAENDSLTVTEDSYIDSDIVSEKADAFAEEVDVTTAGEEEIGPDTTPLPKTLKIGIGANDYTYPSAGTTAFNALVCGTYLPAVTFTAHDGSATAAYSPVTWTLMKVDNPDIVPASNKYTDDNLLPAQGDLEALGLTVESTNSTFTIKGRPTQMMDTAKEFVLRAVDDDYEEGGVKVNRAVSVFNVYITKAVVTADQTNTTAATWTKSTAVSDSDPAKDFAAGEKGGTLAFPNTKMNYTVDASKDETAGTNVKPVKIALTASLDQESALAFSDANYKIVDAQGKVNTDFEVSADTTELYNGHPITLTVQPKVGLIRKNDTNTTYSAALEITHKAFPKKTIALSMTVTNDLSFFVKQGSGEEIQANTLTLNPINVGKAIDPIVITAKGGNGDITITKKSSSDWIEGLSGSTTPASGSSAYTITGIADPVAANALTNYTIALTATDSKGNKVDGTFTIRLATADVSFDFEGTEIEAGNAASTDYSWFAPQTYTASDYKTVVTITNDSKKDMKLKATLSGGDAASFTLGANKDEIVVEKDGGTAELEITPPSSITGAKTATLTFTGNGLAATAVTITFDKTSSNLEITSPKDETVTLDSNSYKYATLAPFEIGEPVDVTFKAIAASGDNAVFTLANDAEITALGSGDVYDAYTKLIAGSTTPTVVAATLIDGETLKDYGLTLTRSGRLYTTSLEKVATGNYLVCVKATESGNIAYKLALFEISKPADPLVISKDSLKLEASTIVPMGEMKQDATEGPSTSFKIKNDTGADIGGVFVTVTDVFKKNTSGAYVHHQINSGDVDTWAEAQNIFDVIYSANETLNTEYNTNGIEIKGNKDVDIALKVKKIVSTGAGRNDLVPGEYKAVVKVNSADMIGTYNFNVTFKIVATPTITFHASTPNKNYGVYTEAGGNEYVVDNPVGTQIKGDWYTAALAGDSEAQFTFSWAKKDGETNDIASSGLALDAKGRIHGKAAKAGTYKVVITAKKIGDDSIVATLEDTITIAGTSVATVTVGGTALDTGDAYVLPGVAVNDAQKEAAQLKVAIATADAKGLKVTVTDAEDDRFKTNTADLADMKKNPGNPYAGSTSFINVTTTDLGDVNSGNEKIISITTKGDTKKSVHKVKITISGDNLVAEKSFYAYLFTSPKLEVETPEGTTIGVQKAANIKLSVKDPDSNNTTWNGQAITWTEKDKNPGLDSITGTLALANGNKSVAGITGTPTVTGTFPITYEVTAAATPVPAYTGGPAFADKIYNVRDGIAEGGSGTSKLKNTGNAGLGAQTSAKMTFPLVIEGSDDVHINFVSNANPGVTGDNNDEGYLGTVVNGKPEAAPTGYVMKTRPVGYAPADSRVTVTVKNESASYAHKVKAEFAKGDNSEFEVSFTGSPEATITTSGTLNFVITPKANLATGSYEDTLTISGKTIKPINFKVKFAVEAVSYKLYAGYSNAAKSPNPTTTGGDDSDAVKAKLEKLTAVVTDSAKVADITLVPQKEGTAANPNDNVITVKNTGNSTISNISVFESNASGVKVADGQEKLSLGALATSIVPGTGTTTNTIQSTGIVSFGSENLARFTIVPKNSNTVEAGSYSTFITFGYKEGTTAKTVTVPVKYVVYTKNAGKAAVDVTDPVTLTKQNEGYSPASAKKDIKVSNAATTGSGEEYALYGLKVSIDQPEYFDLITTETEFAASTKYETYTMKNPLGVSKSLTFTVQPKEGLAAGRYTTTFSAKSDNMKSSIQREIVFEVTATQKFKTNVYSADAVTNKAKFAALNGVAPNAIDESYAKRLYTTLVVGTATATTDPSDANAHTSTNKYVKKIGDMSANHTYIVLDLDKDGTGDVTITLNTTKAGATGAIASKNDVKAATITWTGDTDITSGSVKFELSADEVKIITGAGDDPYFTDLTFDLYSMVTIDPTTDAAGVHNTPNATAQIVELSTALINDNVAVYIKSGSIDTGDEVLDYVWALVPNGSTAASVFTAGALPTAKLTDKGFSGWTKGTATVTGSTVVTGDVTYAPKWHEHRYADADDKDPAHVKWVWTGNETDGYTDVKLFLYCVENCPDSDKGVQEFSVETAKKGGNPAPTITVTENAGADCIHGPRTEYKAMVTYLTKTYEDTKATKEDKSKAKGHKYSTTIEWKKQADGTYKPEIKQVCSECAASTEGHSVTIADANITVDVKEEKKPTCVDKGKATYTITSFVDGNKKTVTGDDLKKIENYTTTQDLDALGHKVEFEFSDVDLEKLKAKAVVKCTVCGEELFNGEVKLTDKGDGTFTCEVTGKDGIKYTGEYVDHIHNWVAKWADWTRKDPTDKFSWETSLTLTCTVGSKPETRTPAVTITKLVDPVSPQYTDYTATATFEGKTYTSDIWTVDSVTGEPTSKHEHKWSLTKWNWTSKDNATASFTCSVGKETKEIAASISAVKTNSKGNTQYKATVVGPDSKEYSDLKWYDASGNPTSGEGIGIEGLADEYEYTGTAIKPVFTVVDYEADKTLVANTDYTIKWTNNNPKITALPMTATVTIKGKGNYDKQEVSRTFTIVNPTKDEDVSTYYTVKSVKTSKETLTYDGTAKYPATVTVKTDAGDVIAAWNGSEYELPTTATKSLKFSVSNNIDKGTGTVAVYGNDGKGKFTTKKATFSIKACDLSALGDKLEITTEAAPYAKSGATTKVTVNFTNESGDTFTLVEGRDYTVKYEYYGNPKKDAGTEAAGAYIVGKGNYTKNTKNSKISKFDIEALALTDDNVAVEAYDKTAVKSLKIKVFDGQGNEINKKYYSLVRVEKGGDELAPATKLAAGDEISVTIKGDGKNVSDTEYTVSTKVGAKMSSAKINAKNVVKTYTGEPITLDSEDWAKISVTVKINGADVTLEQGTDFEVVGYKNNNKKGSMTVIIRGLGSDEKPVNGTKNFTVKVNAKTIKDAEGK